MPEDSGLDLISASFPFPSLQYKLCSVKAMASTPIDIAGFETTFGTETGGHAALFSLFPI